MDSKMPMDREDVVSYPVPMTKLARSLSPKLAKLVTNIVYVGVLAELLGITDEALHKAVAGQFKGKASAIELNTTALELGRNHAKENFTKSDPYVVESRAIEQQRFFMEGNEATALGCIFGGVQLLAWYPITPSSSLAEGIIGWLPRLRTNDEGESTCAVIQAEDELAAIGMVIGANWNGARAFTATSGPGISLMSEFLGLAYFAEVPAVLVNIQRGGPSTGMPTRTQQSDITACAYASHGDTKHVLLFPSNPSEAFNFAMASFDLAERLQTPITVSYTHLTLPTKA